MALRAEAVRTFNAVGYTMFDADDAVPELLLRSPQVLVGGGQVLDFIVELLLHLRKLLER